MHSSYIKEPPRATRAVVMLHGICGSPRRCDWLLPEFDDSWSVYNILLEGHGGSVADFAASSMEKWKSQTKALLDDLCGRYETVILIGYSMGTLLHIYNMPDHPRIKGALLFNTPIRPRLRVRMLGTAYRFTRGRTRSDNCHEAACHKGISLTPEKLLRRYISCIPRFRELKQLSRYCRRHTENIQIPCYAYFGRQDELVSLRSANYLRDNPNVSVRIFDSAGHFWCSEADQETILRDLRQLLRTV